MKTFGYVAYITVLILAFSYAAMNLTSKMIVNRMSPIIEKSCVKESQVEEQPKESLNILQPIKSK